MKRKPTKPTKPTRPTKPTTQILRRFREEYGACIDAKPEDRDPHWRACQIARALEAVELL